MPTRRQTRQVGFTLIELLVVIAIIGILIALILVASADGVRRAEERQTQTLIAKLETAINDRFDAVLATNAPINQTHRYLAAVTFKDANNFLDPITSSIDRRAQVIAQFDHVKAELPDVFYVSTADPDYPINFAMPPYPLVTNPTRENYVLPLGNHYPGLPFTTPSNPPTYTTPTPGFDPVSGFNDLHVPTPPPGLIVTPDSGMYGASFTAAASLYKNLYEAAASDVISQFGAGVTVNAKAGYDGVDNGGLSGFTDDMQEVTVGNGATFADFQAAVTHRLAKHNHLTARSEMMYALLVEGQGPLGSAYNASDFTNRDVADTDGDGLPEFIDAWGQPLQFYRWPIYYGAVVGSSDSQMAYQPFPTNPGPGNSVPPRQIDPLDPNNLLVAANWWAPNYNNSGFNTGLPHMVASVPVPDFSTAFASSPASPQANAFMSYFHILVDPLAAQAPSNTSLSPNWDRTGATRRRAYYSKFLVLSGGPDKEIGVFRLAKDYQSDVDSTLSPAVAFPTGNPITDAHLLNWCESQAAQVEYTGRAGQFLEQIPTTPTPTTSYLQANSGLDDVTNQSLSAPGAGAK